MTPNARRLQAELVIASVALYRPLFQWDLDPLDAWPWIADPRPRAVLAAIRAGAEDDYAVAKHMSDELAGRSDCPEPPTGWLAGWLIEHLLPLHPGREEFEDSMTIVRSAFIRRQLSAVLHDPESDRPLDETVHSVLAQATVDPMTTMTSQWDTTVEPPPRDWVFPGWVPAGRVTLLTGPGGAGKSLLVLQLLASVAACRPEPTVRDPHRWPFGLDLDPRAPTTNRAQCPGHVLYLGWEDEPEEVLRRLHWIDVDGAELADRLHYMSLEGHGPLWGPEAGQHESVAATVRMLGKKIERQLAKLDALDGYPVRLLVIDPVAGAFGSNENSRALVRQFMGWLSALARQTHTAVVVVAHPPKHATPTNTYSGSTDWLAAARSMMTLEVADSGTGEVLTKADGTPKKTPLDNDKRKPAPAWRLRRNKASYASPDHHAWLVLDIAKDEGGRVTRLRWREATPKAAAERYAADRTS